MSNTRLALLLVLLLPPSHALAQYAPRQFNVVAPAGHEVQQVDGAAVLRLPGQRYGSVLTFVPESAVTGWITLAVVNTGGESFNAKTADISAYYGRTSLKVHKTSALIREQTKRRREMLEYSQYAEGKSLDDLTSPTRALDEAREAGSRSRISGQRRSDVEHPNFVAGNADGREAKALADAQLIALRERLFPDATIAPGDFSRGDVRVDLPPRRLDQPAEFVLRMDFAGEPMEVTFREGSVASVDVGEIEAADAID